MDLEKKLKIVVQNGPNPTPVLKKQIEQILKVPVSEILPYDSALADMLSISGTPFVVSHPSVSLSKIVNRLARELGGIKVGLALSSGMAPGLAHIGVLKVFEREKIPIDIIAGTSGGALFGSAIARGVDPASLEKIAIDVTRKFLWMYSDFTIPYSGFVRGKTLQKIVNKVLRGAEFSDLSIPFKILAADLQSGEPVILDQGKISEAIRASISVPGIFTPVRIGDRLLVDGAAISPVPVTVLQQCGADIVIAVNVNVSPDRVVRTVEKTKPNFVTRLKQQLATPNFFDVIMQSRAISAHRMAELDSARADVVVKPDTSAFKWRDYNKSKEIIQTGIEAAEKAVPRIKDLISSTALKR